MRTMTLYTCHSCAAVFGNVKYIKIGEEGFPKDGSQWDRYFKCPICKEAKQCSKDEVLLDSE